MLQTAISLSDDIEIVDALSSIIDDCRAQLGGKLPQAGILLTSRMDVVHRELLQRVTAEFPGVKLVGCTTDGEIASGKGFRDDAIALLLMVSGKIEFATAIARDISADPYGSFAQAYSQGRAQLGSDPVFGLVFPDGLTTVGIPLDKAIAESFEPAFPVFGGTAGDNFQIKQTFQFFGDEVYTDAAAVLLFAGNVELKAQICIGVEPMGRFHSLDECANNIVMKIDGKRAADVYEELLGENVNDQLASQFPLAIYTDRTSSEYCLRDPLTVNKEDGTVEFIGNFPDKCHARFVAISSEQLLSAADTVNSYLLDEGGGWDNDLIFIFSCASRKHLLGSQAQSEFTQLMQNKQTPFFGFYCYGEIGPASLGAPPLFHNDTYVAVGLRSPSHE